MNRLGLLKPAAVACAAVLALTTTSWAQSQKYGVTATVVKNFDATAVKTYTWTPGRPSTDKGIDGQIIAAVDRELAAVGLKPAAAGQPEAGRATADRPSGRAFRHRGVGQHPRHRALHEIPYAGCKEAVINV